MAIATAALLTLIQVGLPEPARSYHQIDDPFCTGTVIRDYSAPLAALPKVRELPASGRLPFAPRGLWLGGGEANVIRAGDSIQFRFLNRGPARAEARLGWYVTSRLVQVDRSGRAVRVAKRKRQRIGLIHKIEKQLFGFARSPRPGLYRFDIAFRDRTGELLGRYHAYYGVVRRRLAVRLHLKGNLFRPGDVIYGRVENRGTEWLFYGEPNSIERYDGTDWVRLNLRRAFSMIGILGPPGTVGRCTSNFRVPTDFAPGHYRMVKQVSYSDRRGLVRGRGGLSRAGRPLTLTAEFEVVP